MQTQETKKFEASNLWGEKRKYTFYLLDAETGLRIFHQFAHLLSAAHEEIMPLLERLGIIGDNEDLKNKDEDKLRLGQIVNALTSVFSWDVVKELCCDLTANTKIETDEKEFITDASGITELSKGDPLEQYIMLFFSICANYPKYIGFLGLALEGNDSSQGTGQNQES